MIPSGSALFTGTAAQFVDWAPSSRLTDHLVRQFEARWGSPTESEVKSWRRSLGALARVAGLEAGLDAGVAVEVSLPFTDRRIDVSFVAKNADDRPTVVLIELKQWEVAAPSAYPDNVVVGGREHLHPSVQVAAYADYLRGIHSAFTEDDYGLLACAYLHDMPSGVADSLRRPPYADVVQSTPLFARDDHEALAELLQESLVRGDGLNLLNRLVEGRYAPAKGLVEAVGESLQKESPAWVLLDEQRLAFNLVSGLAHRTARQQEKAVLMVVGGPGTGKSAIAVHLLVHLGREFSVCHATGSKAFTTNLRALVPRSAHGMFRYFNSFQHRKTPENAVDVLVCDEAHRIRKTSNSRYTPRRVKSEISQVRELIRASRISVFFLDEHQNVRPDEVGTVDEIEQGAREEGVPVLRVDLTGQFRCNGCPDYVDWVDTLLSDHPQPIGRWLESSGYDLQVFNSPARLEAALERKVDEGSSGRMVAGFCWPWSDPTEDDELVADVRIGSWRRPWNMKPPEQCRPPQAVPPPGRHPYYVWATQPQGFSQIGCIYSAQGFEFDYCGVILADDYVWRTDRWVAKKEESEDPAIRRTEATRVPALIRHAYRVLLTRGMRGTYAYSTDRETLEFLMHLRGT